MVVEEEWCDVDPTVYTGATATAWTWRSGRRRRGPGGNGEGRRGTDVDSTVSKKEWENLAV
jgi:hypothetical protein